MKEKMSVVKVLKSIISGDILLVMGVHRLFPYILYAFILGWVSIWMSYKAEQTMTLVEANKKELETLKIHHAQKTCEYVGLDRISTIEEKPADIIKK